jgi:hypothetical protein
LLRDMNLVSPLIPQTLLMARGPAAWGETRVLRL